MTRQRRFHRRRFHFKSPPLKDLHIQRFKEWSYENKGFYTGFRDWLKENGYGRSTLNVYGAATRMAIGYLRKPYWTIDPETDLERVQEHLSQSYRTLNTQTDYRKGLHKLEEYLRLRCHRPKKEKELPWEYTIGSLPPILQNDVREFLVHCQRAWKIEHRWERSRDTLYALGIPLRWMAEQAGLNDVAGLTPQVWYAFLDYRFEAGMKPETVNSDLSSLRHFVYFVRGAGRAVCERFLLVEPLKAGWRMPKDVPLEGLRKLQATIQAQANATHLGCRRIGRMDLAWFLLMLHCGLRTCEVRHLKLQDIEWDAKRLRIEQSKALKDRQIYLDSFRRFAGISGGAWTGRRTAPKCVHLSSCAAFADILFSEIGNIRTALRSQGIASPTQAQLRDTVVERGRACTECANDPRSQADRHNAGICALV